MLDGSDFLQLKSTRQLLDIIEPRQEANLEVHLRQEWIDSVDVPWLHLLEEALLHVYF